MRTELVRSRIHETDSAPDDRHLYLKPENLQPIGAFKLRGAYNKIASVTQEERDRGVCTASLPLPPEIMRKVWLTRRGRWA